MKLFVIHEGVVMTFEEAAERRKQSNREQQRKLEGYVTDRELYQLALTAINYEISETYLAVGRMENLRSRTNNAFERVSLEDLLQGLNKDLSRARQKRVYLQEVLDGLG